MVNFMRKSLVRGELWYRIFRYETRPDDLQYETVVIFSLFIVSDLYY